VRPLNNRIPLEIIKLPPRRIHPLKMPVQIKTRKTPRHRLAPRKLNARNQSDIFPDNAAPSSGPAQKANQIIFRVDTKITTFGS
jgi:hypothetical protein